MQVSAGTMPQIQDDKTIAMQKYTSRMFHTRFQYEIVQQKKTRYRGTKFNCKQTVQSLLFNITRKTAVVVVCTHLKNILGIDVQCVNTAVVQIAQNVLKTDKRQRSIR